MKAPKEQLEMLRAINEHCDKGNGIYCTAGRMFRAVIVQSDLYEANGVCVTPDFGKTWMRIQDDWFWWDYNGRPVGNLPAQPRA